MSTHSLDELKDKVLPLFKSQDPAFIRQGMLLIDTVFEEQPEILDVFKDQRGKWDTSWIGKSTIDLEVRVWLMGCRAKLGARITHLHCREHSLTPLEVPSSLPYLTTLESMEVSAYGLSETLVQVIEHNPNIRRVELNLYDHYSQKFSYKEMMIFQDRLNRVFKSMPNVTYVMMRIQMEFQDETKAFKYDLSNLESIDKIWIQHRANATISRIPPVPLDNFIWVQLGDSTGQILDPQGFPDSLTNLSLYSITTGLAALLTNVPKENITRLELNKCTHYTDLLDAQNSPAMLYTIDTSGQLSWTCMADFNEHNATLLDARIKHVEDCGDALNVRTLDFIRGSWTLPVLHKMPNLEKMHVERLENIKDLHLLKDFTRLKELDMRSLKLIEFPASIELPDSLEKLDLSEHAFAKAADVSGLKHLVDDIILVEDRIENESAYNKSQNDHRIKYLPYNGTSPIHPTFNTFRLEHLCDKVDIGELTVHQLCMKDFKCSSYDVNWGALKDLEVLDLRNLDLSKLPQALTSCANLRVVYTKETDAVKDAALVQSMRSALQFLHCKRDDVTALDESTVQSLKSLSLRGCMLKTLPEALSDLHDIEFLDLSFNMLKTEALNIIQSAPELWGLDVSLTSIKAPENGFPMFPNLKVIYLAKNQFEDPSWATAFPTVELRQKMRG
mgnify:CR=1 FL=1